MSVDAIADAEIVVVGGGAIGCGVAYSLARAGHKDVLLLEREPALAAVTTSQGAGLAGQLRTSPGRVRLAMWSIKTFNELQRAPGDRPNWHGVGSLRLALSEARAEEFRRLKQVAGEAGLEADFITAKEAARHWPGMEFSGCKAILWCPSDGFLTTRELTHSYAYHARELGARLSTGVEVQSVLLRNGRVHGVQTDRGAIQCRLLINAAGAHAFHIARLAGLELPIIPVRHEYYVSNPIEGLSEDLPCFRIPDATLYGRIKGHSLLLGGWEPNALAADPRQYALGKPAPTIEPDWKVLRRFAQLMAPHYAKVLDGGEQEVFKGWPTFTPDGQFIIGESSRVPGFVMAGGCNAHGVSGSAGIGRHLVEALFEPKPSEYVRGMSPDRFTENPWQWSTAMEQARKVYEEYYALGH